MKKASDYRRHAKECRQLAAQMQSPEHRDQLLWMAARWDDLAEDRLALISRHPELTREGERDEDPGAAARRARR